VVKRCKFQAEEKSQMKKMVRPWLKDKKIIHPVIIKNIRTGILLLCGEELILEYITLEKRKN
jgi:hypothetical protein